MSAESDQGPPNGPVECSWSKNMDQAFLSAQRELTIFLKDGYSFFKANADILTRRFADPSKTTVVLIAHPDSPHMAAIANMDEKKKDDPESQRSDCRQAVQVLQGIRENLRADTGEDCAARVVFMGHDHVPTWNGFIGDNEAVINLYTTRPYRGPLPSLRAETGRSIMYDWASQDCALIRRGAPPERADLWNYRLPNPLPDLRR